MGAVLPLAKLQAAMRGGWFKPAPATIGEMDTSGLLYWHALGNDWHYVYDPKHNVYAALDFYDGSLEDLHIMCALTGATPDMRSDVVYDLNARAGAASPY